MNDLGYLCLILTTIVCFVGLGLGLAALSSRRRGLTRAAVARVGCRSIGNALGIRSNEHAVLTFRTSGPTGYARCDGVLQEPARRGQAARGSLQRRAWDKSPGGKRSHPPARPEAVSLALSSCHFPLQNLTDLPCRERALGRAHGYRSEGSAETGRRLLSGLTRTRG